MRTLSTRSRGSIFLISAVVCATLARNVLAASTPILPNIVFILTDDQGYADVGKFGSEGFETPNLDHTAAEGAVFRNFHDSQPICSNRLDIHRALMPNSRVGISGSEMTLAQLLKQRGYATGMMGKWHLGDSPQFMPLRHGFDEYFGLVLSSDIWPGHPDLIPGMPA